MTICGNQEIKDKADEDMSHKSRTEQYDLKVRKDPKKRAYTTKYHRDASVYVRPTAASTQGYIDELNEDWK